MTDNSVLCNLFRLKIRLFLRVLKEFSLPQFFVVGLIIIAIFYLFARICDLHPLNYYVLGGMAAVLVTIHHTRRDYHFCEMALIWPFILFAVEYSLVTLPYAIISFVGHQYLIALLYMMLPMIVAIIPRKRFQSDRIAWPLLISMPSLEATSFFRKYRLLIWAMLLFAFVMCFVSAISVIVLFFIIIFFASVSFSQAESLTLLCIEELPARLFLNRKIKRELIFWAKLSLPVCLLYSAFNVDTAYFVLIPILLGPLYIIFCISAKYKMYQPNSKIDGTVTQAICMLGYVIPLFLPVSIIMTFVYYSQAIDRLNTFLDAYNK